MAACTLRGLAYAARSPSHENNLGARTWRVDVHVAAANGSHRFKRRVGGGRGLPDPAPGLGLGCGRRRPDCRFLGDQGQGGRVRVGDDGSRGAGSASGGGGGAAAVLH